MLQRGINESTILEILKNPDFIENSFGGRKIAVKKIDALWKIVFIEEEEKIIVISVFFF